MKHEGVGPYISVRSGDCMKSQMLGGRGLEEQSSARRRGLDEQTSMKGWGEEKQSSVCPLNSEYRVTIIPSSLYTLVDEG